MVSEFQGFVRDLHDLAADIAVNRSGADQPYHPLLVAAATEGRYIDRGNADLRSLTNDLKRLGISGLSGRIGARNKRWIKVETYRGDQAYYQDLIELRNCLAHGNQAQLDRLRSRRVKDTMTYTRRYLPKLDRIAAALDRLVWDHLHDTFGADPW